MKLVFNPVTSAFDYVASTAADVGLTGLATNITAGKTLTLTAADDYTLTIPATGTAALLGMANVFTTQQMVDGTSDQIQLRVQANGTQTANLQTWENSSGNVLSFISPLGQLAVNTNTIASNEGMIVKAITSGLTDTVFIAKNSSNDQIFNVRNDGLFQVGASGFTGFASVSSSLTGANSVTSAILGIKNNKVQTSAEFNISLFATNAQTFSSGSGGAVRIVGSYALGSGSADYSSLTISTTYNQSGSASGVMRGIHINPTVTSAINYVALEVTTGNTILNNATATTNAVVESLRLQSTVSTATTGSTNGFGVSQTFYAETATNGTNQLQGLISTSWVDATNATRKAKLSLSAYDTAARLGLEIEASGTEPMIGFYGVAPIARAVLATGAGASVDDVITALQNLGLVKQS